jgi:hypothetical protein
LIDATRIYWDEVQVYNGCCWKKGLHEEKNAAETKRLEDERIAASAEKAAEEKHSEYQQIAAKESCLEEKWVAAGKKNNCMKKKLQLKQSGMRMRELLQLTRLLRKSI